MEKIRNEHFSTYIFDIVPYKKVCILDYQCSVLSTIMLHVAVEFNAIFPFYPKKKWKKDVFF